MTVLDEDLNLYEAWLAEPSSKPTFYHAIPGDDSMGEDACLFAKAIGVILDDWQEQLLKDWLRVKPDGTFTHPTVVLLANRQNGKTLVIQVYLLFLLYLGPDNIKNILYAAHKLNSTLEVFRGLLELIEGNPDLARRTKRVYTAAGGQRIIAERGSEIRFASRVSTMGAGIRGWSIDCVVLDEALILTETYLSSLLPTLSARPNTQVMYASSSGDADSVALGNLRTAAYTRPAGMTMSEWAADPTMPGFSARDERMWARVNQALPHRLGIDAVRSEYATLSESSFLRERCGVWSTGAPDPALNYDLWQAALVPDAGFPSPGAATLALDVTITDNERHAALAAAWLDPATGKPTAVLVHSAPSTDWIPGKVTEVANRFAVGTVAFSPGGASDVVDSVQHLVPIESVPFGKLRAAAQWLTEQLATGEVQIQSSPTLNDVARTTHRRKSGTDGGWLFSSHLRPAAPLNATSLALMLCATAAPAEPAIW